MKKYSPAFQERRFARVQVDMALLADMLIGPGDRYEALNVPADLEVLAIEQNFEERCSGRFTAIVASCDFAPVPENEHAPLVGFAYRRLS